MACRQCDAADLALRRALDDASDRLDTAATVNTLAWLLIRQGRFTGTRALAAEWADDAEPRMSRATMAELSAWGRLLVRLSAAAVRNNQPDGAEDAIRRIVSRRRTLTPDMREFADFIHLPV